MVMCKSRCSCCQAGNVCIKLDVLDTCSKYRVLKSDNLPSDQTIITTTILTLCSTSSNATTRATTHIVPLLCNQQPELLVILPASIILNFKTTYFSSFIRALQYFHPRPTTSRLTTNTKRTSSSVLVPSTRAKQIMSMLQLRLLTSQFLSSS